MLYGIMDTATLKHARRIQRGRFMTCWISGARWRYMCERVFVFSVKKTSIVYSTCAYRWWRFLSCTGCRLLYSHECICPSLTHVKSLVVWFKIKSMFMIKCSSEIEACWKSDCKLTMHLKSADTIWIMELLKDCFVK